LFAYGIWAALVWRVNITPLFRAEQDELAYINIVLLIFSPVVFAEAQHLGKFYGRLARIFVAAAMFGCYFNSLNGIADKKDSTSADRQTKLVQFGEWKTKIEGYEAQANQLPKPDHYIYTTEIEYQDKKTSLENATKKVERECEPTFIRKSIDRDKAQRVCDVDRSAEITQPDVWTFLC
jgi:hypothetical protein